MAVPKNLVDFTLETFNSLHDRLKFTLEFGDDKINFLDITIINPSYSPEMAPCDFFLFPKLKRTPKRRFSTIEEIKKKSLAELKAIPKEAFQQCFASWKQRWQKCIVL
ncbi:hypothetical protein ALC57_11779 [Trachymyrmex cornetzi]|uniref:Uncharacterized protein n=1 Tax=Trachymyrmex cornetzi TaxID=471704 RepID=A0A151J1V6_9HYME|nr:hypothetical protein ALC57_11779 [Trachymyrmex cornetzi]